MKHIIILIVLASLIVLNFEDLSAQVFDQVYPSFPANEITDMIRWNGDTLFICGFNWTLQRSTDAGATWKEMMNGYPKYNLVQMGSDGNYLYLLPVPTGFTKNEMENDPHVLILRYDPRIDVMTKLYVDRLPSNRPAGIQMMLSVGHSVVSLLQVYQDSVQLSVSTDTGMSWGEVRLPDDCYNYDNIHMDQLCFRDPRNAMVSMNLDPLLHPGSNVYITNDGQDSWTQISTVQQQYIGYNDTPRPPGGWFGDSLVVLIHERTTPVISTDRGTNWRWCAPVNGVIESVSFEASGTGYCSDEIQQIWKTTDFGSTWVKCREGIAKGPTGEVLGCILQIGPDTVVTVDFYGQIQRTVDGGLTWDAIRMADVWNFHNLQFVTPLIGYVRATARLDYRDRYLRTTDGGVTWEDFGDFPVGNQTPYFHYLDDEHAFAVRYHNYLQSSDTLIFRSTTGGSHWEPVYFWSNADSINLDLVVRGHWFASKDTGYAPVNGNRLLRTTDGGESWNLLPGPVAVMHTGPQISLKWMDARESPIVWIAATRDILRSDDAGVTWTAVLSLPDTVDNIYGFLRVEELPDGGTIVFTRESVYYSTDNGDTWEHWPARVTSGAFVQFSKLAGLGLYGGFQFSDYGSQRDIMSTKDGWRSLHLEGSFGYGGIDSFVFMVFLDKLHGWVYGLNAIYRTTNGGVNWTNVTPSIPQSPRILSTWPQPVTHGRMMSTEVELTLPGPVKIELYDLLGRRLAEVFDAEVEAGRRTARWPTARLDHGVYILRLLTANGTASSKVVVQ